jgi:spore maturation protein CgeB
MKITFLVHSLASDWNHGNAHFVRGVVAELLRRGHDVQVWEPADAWSRQNLERDHGPDASAAYHEAYPQLSSQRYDPEAFDAAAVIADRDLVVVHEWTPPPVVAAVGQAHTKAKSNGATNRLLFHDTHHRCVSAPQQMQQFDLQHYDGVLAFGGLIRDWYRRHHNLPAFTWHEAADPHVFHPDPGVTPEADLVWIGNWGDDERAEELNEYLLDPVRELGLSCDVYGVRYPDHAVQALAKAGIRYHGYLPNHRVAGVFARHRLTVHVPRRFYTTTLPGIPTIRPFEALACGIPLISAPWSDAEGLFRVDTDFRMVHSGTQMKQALRQLLTDDERRRTLAEHGRQTVLNRHTCAHRVDELLHILEQLDPPAAATPPTAPAEGATP